MIVHTWTPADRWVAPHDRGKDVREIQDYLGHKNIQNTVGYTRLRPGRFDNMWE